MVIARRRLLKAISLAGGFRPAGSAQERLKLPVDVLRDVSMVHGTNLSDARLETIRPALERRLSELRALRDLEIDDAVGPTQGIPPE